MSASALDPDQKQQSLWGAYLIWRQIAGPFADFVLPTPFLAEWEAEPRPARHPQARRLARAIASRVNPGTAVYLETSPRLGLATGTSLSASGWGVVPMIGRWPASRAVLPLGPLVNWLASPSPAADAPASAPPAGRSNSCFLLDGERSRPVSPATLRRRFDNRYGYGAFALPPAAHLTRQDISRILWICPTAGAPPDLVEYVESLIAAGLTLEFLPLSQLTSSRRSPFPLLTP